MSNLEHIVKDHLPGSLNFDLYTRPADSSAVGNRVRSPWAPEWITTDKTTKQRKIHSLAQWVFKNLLNETMTGQFYLIPGTVRDL